MQYHAYLLLAPCNAGPSPIDQFPIAQAQPGPRARHPPFSSRSRSTRYHRPQLLAADLLGMPRLGRPWQLHPHGPHCPLSSSPTRVDHAAIGERGRALTHPWPWQTQTWPRMMQERVHPQRAGESRGALRESQVEATSTHARCINANVSVRLENACAYHCSREQPCTALHFKRDTLLPQTSLLCTYSEVCMAMIRELDTQPLRRSGMQHTQRHELTCKWWQQREDCVTRRRIFKEEPKHVVGT